MLYSYAAYKIELNWNWAGEQSFILCYIPVVWEWYIGVTLFVHLVGCELVRIIFIMIQILHVFHGTEMRHVLSIWSEYVQGAFLCQVLQSELLRRLKYNDSIGVCPYAILSLWSEILSHFLCSLKTIKDIWLNYYIFYMNSVKMCKTHFRV